MSDLKLSPSSKVLYALAVTGLFLLPSGADAQTKASGQKSTSGSTHSHSAKSNSQNSQSTDGQNNTGSGVAAGSAAGSQSSHSAKKDEIATLRKAKRLLEEAKHDYKAHRARAMHAIHEAIHELEERGQNQHAQNGHAGSSTSGSSAGGQSSGLGHGTSAGAHPGHTASNAGSTNHNSSTQQRQANSNNQSSDAQMTQADSDSRLRSAEQLLMQAQAQIGGKHVGASTHIQVALTEVQQALQVKQGTSQQ
jgi:hypothetical protein